MGVMAAIGIGIAAVGVGAAGAASSKKSKGTPSAPSLSLPDIQKSAMAGNLEIMPQAKELASQVNTFQQNENLRLLKNAVPEWETLMKQSLGVTQSQLTGQFAPGEEDALKRMGSSLGVGSGTVGSEFGKFKTLGLTFNALEQRYNQGLSSANQWLQVANNLTKTPLFDFGSSFIDPAQAAGFAQKERDVQYQNALLKWQQPSDLAIAGSGLSSFGGLLAGVGAVGGLDGLMGGRSKVGVPSDTFGYGGGGYDGPFGQPLPPYQGGGWGTYGNDPGN